MIVEPVPAATRSRRRRFAGRLALAVPVVVFVGVVGLGVLGGDGEPPGSPRSSVTARASEASGAPAPTPAATRLLSMSSVVAGGSAPADLDGLRVRGVEEVLAERAAGALEPPTTPLAVAGYLGTPYPPMGCTDADGARVEAPTPIDVLGPLCTRDAILAAFQWSLAGSEGFTGIGPHLHVIVPVGVDLPDGIERTTMIARGGPIEAVLFGRFDAPLPPGCRAVTSDCDLGFVVESVAWADSPAAAIRRPSGGGVGRGYPL